jgi:predicted transposase/invertase (TIGR01784 family)
LFSYDQRENETFELYDRSKTSFYFLELSRMREKDWSRLQKNPERWCYLFKNMANFADERDLPGDLHGFEEVLEASRFDTLSPEDMTIYELNAAKEHELLSSNMYQYNKGLQEGMEKGIEKGIEKERLSNARKLKALGVDPDIICQATGLSAEEVAAL